MQRAIVAGRPTPTNLALTHAAAGGRAWVLATPGEALRTLGPGDVALGRLDVLETLDGVDEGMPALAELARRGVRVLNGPGMLLATHDKLLTARLLRNAGLPHPPTTVVRSSRTPCWTGPVVVKPRFGSWGRDVQRCETAAELRAHIDGLSLQPWFRRHGALVQHLVTPRGYDLRIVVAGGRVVGAVIRVSRDGEWRTNVALGARRIPTQPPAEARRLAVAAAAAARASLVGVDLLPDGHGGWTVLELNGAVEFTDEYARDRGSFAAATRELTRLTDADARQERQRPRLTAQRLRPVAPGPLEALAALASPT